MNDDEINNRQQPDDREKSAPTYDVAGLLIGGGVGILLSITGLIDFLMSITAGMFLGLLVGTFIKK